MASDTVFITKVPSIAKTLIHDFDITDEDAAAILGNAGHESAGLTTFQEIGIKPPFGGFGWMQWTGPRRRNFEAYCKRNKLDPMSDKANYGFLFVELTGPEKRSIPALKKAIGLKEKVIAFESAFERAGVKHYDSRLAWAEKALQAIRTAPIATPVDPLERPPTESVLPPPPNPILDAAVKRASAAVTETAASPDNQMSGPAVADAKAELNANIKEAIAPVVEHFTNTEAHFYQRRSFWGAVGSGFSLVFSVGNAVIIYMQAHTLDSGTISVSLAGALFAAWGGYSSWSAGHSTTPLWTKKPEPYPLNRG